MSDNHINVTYDGEKSTRDLTTDDYLMFNTSILSSIPENNEHLTYEQGLLVGLFIGDGTFGNYVCQDGSVHNFQLSLNKDKWDKVKVYTDLIFKGSGVQIKNYAAGISACYKKEVYDENIPPILLDEKGIISNNDGIIWLNYRIDRSRELLSILTDPNFNLFRTNRPNNLSVQTILPINNMDIDYLLENNEGIYSLTSYLDDLGIKQA